MGTLNFSHLYYFHTIQKLGSIVEASKRLRLTQPTLSTQLRQLENSLGVELFTRKGKRLILNEDGKLAAEFSDQIFQLGDDMVLALRSKDRKRVTKIRGGVLPSVSKRITSDFVSPLFDNKSTTITISEGSLDFLLSELNRNNLDFILSDASAQTGNQTIASYPLKHRHFVAVSSPKMAHLGDNFPSSLNHQPLVTFTGHSQLRHEIDRVLEGLNLRNEVIAECDDVDLLCLLCEKESCFSVLPLSSVSSALRNKSLLELGKFGTLKSDIWVLFEQKSPVSARLLNAIKAFNRQLDLESTEG